MEKTKARSGNYKGIIAQANVLTSAKDDLNVQQRRVLYMCLSHTYTQNWPADGTFNICPKQYSELFNVDVHDARLYIRQALLKFMGDENNASGVRFVEKTKDDEIDVYMPWVSKVKASRKRGDFSININRDLRPYMEPFADDMGKTFMQYDELGALTNQYSQRLYESLSQFRSTGVFVISHDELVSRWTLPDSYKKRRPLLKTNVLDKAMMEIERVSFMIKNLTLTIKRGNKDRAEGYMFLFDKF